jgi:hypothetical protein
MRTSPDCAGVLNARSGLLTGPAASEEVAGSLLSAVVCLRIINDRLKHIVYIFPQVTHQERIVDNAQFQASISRKLSEITSALSAVNDALVQLSLLLEDLLFEIDEGERANAEAEFREVFARIRSSWCSDEFIAPR